MRKFSIIFLVTLLLIALGYAYFVVPSTGDQVLVAVQILLSEEENGEAVFYEFKEQDNMTKALTIYGTLVDRRRPRDENHTGTVVYTQIERSGRTLKTTFTDLDGSEFTELLATEEAQKQHHN